MYLAQFRLFFDSDSSLNIQFFFFGDFLQKHIDFSVETSMSSSGYIYLETSVDFVVLSLVLELLSLS